jgi:membrane protein insertase Oxa1/YidC/SpoIIIJ
LYWSTSNLFRLGQQVVIFRMEGRPTRPGAAEEKETGKQEAEESTTETPTKTQPGSAKKRRRRRRS